MSIAEQLKELAYSLGQRFAEERDRLRGSFAAAASELAATTSAALLSLERAQAAIRNGDRGDKGDPGERGDRGEKGDQGETGATGERGGDGLPGDPGERGEQGEKGETGDPGRQGDKGDPGERGEKGEQGETGEKGEPGQAGDKGEKGDRGEKGEAGQRGATGTFAAPTAWSQGVHYAGELTFLDGSTYSALVDTAEPPPHADWQPVALKGADAYPGSARGLFDAKTTYRRLDRVSLDGSEWIAKSDDPGPLPGEGWMLSARAGGKGRPGERGQPGAQGPKGDPGIGLQRGRLEGYAVVLDLTDGQTLTIDLRPMFDRYDGERA